MERSRQTNSGTVTAMSAQALREAVTEACVAVAISEPTKAVARKTGLTERGVRAIREREHAPSLETAAAFGFAYPSVSTLANFRRMQTDLNAAIRSLVVFVARNDTDRMEG